MSEKKLDISREIVTVLVLGLVLVSSLSIKPVNAQAGQVTLKPSDDTYVDSGNPNSNYGGQNTLNIQYFVFNQTTYEDLVWLKFNLSSVPDGAVIDGATLQVYSISISQTCDIAALSCSNNTWTESTLTYVTMPSYNATPMDSHQVDTIDMIWFNWSVVDVARNTLNSTPKEATIVLWDYNPSSSETLYFESKETSIPFLGGDSPLLAVHWSDFVPEFPTFLVLPLFMMATLLAVIVYRRKLTQISGSP